MTIRSTGLTSKKKGNYNTMITCWSYDFNIKSFFVFNQTSNIFYSKILHISFSASGLLYINSDITFYISALVLSKKKVLQVLQSQNQAACLIVGLQKKTTYKSAPFSSSSGGARDVL